MLLGFALVWILIPHEPDIGFGQPGVSKDRVATAVVHSLRPIVANVAARFERAMHEDQRRADGRGLNLHSFRSEQGGNS